MSELPSRSKSEEDAIFFDLTDKLVCQIVDPYLIDLHAEALDREEAVLRTAEGDFREIKNAHVRELDKKWRYMGMPITLTGMGWPVRGNRYEAQPRKYIEKTGISRGFLFFTNESEEATDHFPHISHLIEVDSDIDGGTKTHIVAPLNGIVQLDLPFPSPELREERFAYYFPDSATTIDELNFTARRDDQVLRDFAEYYIVADLSNDEQLERLRDGAQYLRSRAEINPLATYHISISGDIIVINDDGSGLPVRLAYPYSQTMKISDVALRPADVTVSELKGKHKCVPFVQATSLEPDGAERELLFPCSSILWISSSRYDKQLPPQF